MKSSLYILLGAILFILPHSALAYNMDTRTGVHLGGYLNGSSNLYVIPSDVDPLASSTATVISGCGADGNCNMGITNFHLLGTWHGGSGPWWSDIGSTTPNVGMSGSTVYASFLANDSAYCSAGVCTGAIYSDAPTGSGPYQTNGGFPNFTQGSALPHILFSVNSSGVITFNNPTPTTTHTSIQITSPTQGTSTPTTTFDIDATYTIGTDLNTFSLDGSLPTQVGINLRLLNVQTNQQINLGTDYNITQILGTYTYATTTTLQQSDYTLIATLVGDYGFTPPPPDCTPFPPFTTCTGSGNISTLATALPPPTFSVANGLFPILGFQVGSTTSRSGLATTTCSVVAIGGCFQNALAFLFFPSPDILNQFGQLWSLIQNKPPFGYVSQTINGLRSLNASSSPAFSFGDIPLVDTIFTPFRTGLAALLWVGFFITWYRGRLRHLDI